MHNPSTHVPRPANCPVFHHASHLTDLSPHLPPPSPGRNRYSINRSMEESMIRSWTGENWLVFDRPSINAAAAARMPPAPVDARSISSSELGRSSNLLRWPFHAFFGQPSHRVLLDSSVFFSSSTTNSASIAHMHTHCTRCASRSALQPVQPASSSYWASFCSLS